MSVRALCRRRDVSSWRIDAQPETPGPKPRTNHLTITLYSREFCKTHASTMQNLFGGKSPQEALAEDAAHAVEAVTKLTSSGSELKGMPKRCERSQGRAGFGPRDRLQFWALGRHN